MKIKAVSELTGLTTRTIRVYIDENLIAPKFTENYLGRRSFEFSQEDIVSLQNIAILRKYGFSIDEIRSILLDSQNSIAIIENVKLRTQNQLNEYGERLNALSHIAIDRAYTIEELADELSKTPNTAPVPTEQRKASVLKVVKVLLVFWRCGCRLSWLWADSSTM